MKQRSNTRCLAAILSRNSTLETVFRPFLKKGGEGGRFFIENARAGGPPGERGRGGPRDRRVSAGNLGGVAKYFFSGPKFPPS